MSDTLSEREAEFWRAYHNIKYKWTEWDEAPGYTYCVHKPNKKFEPINFPKIKIDV